MSAKPTMVYPVPGVELIGTPGVAHEVPSVGEAEELVKTGAYALTEAEANAASPWDVAPMRAAEAAAQEAAPVAPAPEEAPAPEDGDGNEEEPA